MSVSAIVSNAELRQPIQPSLELFVACAQNKHGHVVSVFADSLQYSKAIKLGKHQIEDDQIGPALTYSLETLVSIMCKLHPMSFDFKVITQTESQVGIVLYDQNECAEWLGHVLP